MSVNVYTEWDPLKEVIVARCEKTGPVHMDLSFQLFFNDYVGEFLKKGVFELPQQLIEERQEDLDGFQRTLEGLGVRVHRPEPLDEIRRFETPCFDGKIGRAHV